MASNFSNFADAPKDGRVCSARARARARFDAFFTSPLKISAINIRRGFNSRIECERAHDDL